MMSQTTLYCFSFPPDLAQDGGSGAQAPVGNTCHSILEAGIWGKEEREHTEHSSGGQIDIKRDRKRDRKAVRCVWMVVEVGELDKTRFASSLWR